MVTNTISRKASRGISLDITSALLVLIAALVAVTIVAATFASDILMYTSGTLALAGVYTLDRKGGDK